MVVEIIYNRYEGEESKFYVKLKHILSFDTEHDTIFLKKNKTGCSYITTVENFDELLTLWKRYHDNNL